MIQRRRSERRGRSPPEPDTVPPSVVEQAKATFESAARHGEVVALVFDSLLDAGDGWDDYHLRFEHPALRVAVQITAADEAHFDLVGQLDPHQSAHVELEFEHGAVSLVESTHSGEFGFPQVPSGLVRFVLTDLVPSGRLLTDWFRI